MVFDLLKVAIESDAIDTDIGAGPSGHCRGKYPSFVGGEIIR